MHIVNNYTSQGQPTSSDSITGKQVQSENIRHGQQSVSEVQNNSVSSERTEASAISSTLKSLGYKVNDENVRMVKMLLENNFPVTKDNLQKLNQSLKLMGQDSIDKALFFMENDMRASSKNVNTLENIINGNSILSNSLTSVITNMFSENSGLEISDILRMFGDIISFDDIWEAVTASENLNKFISENNISKTEEYFENSVEIRNIVTDNNTLKDGNGISFEKFIFQNKDLIIQQLEKSIKSGSLDSFETFINNMGFKENIDFSEMNKALKLILPDKSTILKNIEALFEAKHGLTENSTNISKLNVNVEVNTKTERMHEPQQESGNTVYSKNTENKNINNLEIKNTMTKDANKLTFEKLVFQNKDFIMPQLEKSIKSGSLDSFKTFINNMGFKENVDFLEMNKVLKLLLWDKPSLLKSFADLPEVKAVLAENPENSVNTNTKIDPETGYIHTSGQKNINIQRQQNATSAFTSPSNKLSFDELKKIFDVPLKEIPNIAKRAEQLLNEKNNAINKIIKNLTFDFSDDSEKIDEYINRLAEKLDTLKTAVSSVDTPAAKETINDINNINNSLDFMSQMKNTVYLQLPITVNNAPATAELYIFKKSKNNKALKNTSSAVLSLELANLGHFEAYIQKNDKNIICQFKTENEEIEKLTASKISILNNALKKYGYTLKQISFKALDQKFSPISKEPSFEETNENKNNFFALDITT